MYNKSSKIKGGGFVDRCVYTVAQLADILQISAKTVYRLIKDKEIRSIRIRGQIRVPSKALEEYLEGGFLSEAKNKR